MARKLLAISFLLLILSCSHFQETQGKPFDGTVVRVEIEGGFYGIITDSGERLDPINLPESFKIDGLSVSGQYVSKPDVQSIRMWGKIVSLSLIHRQPPSSQ